MTDGLLGRGYFAKTKDTGKICARCRWMAPTAQTRGLCRVSNPFAAGEERAKWREVENHDTCTQFSRLRLPSQKPKGPIDLKGQIHLDFGEQA